MPMIIIRGSEVEIDGVNVGTLPDALANYPAFASEIQEAWDLVNSSVEISA